MKIGVDMDEVIADFLSAYINYLNNEHRLDLTRDRFTRYYIWDTCEYTFEEIVQLFDTFYVSEHFKKVSPIQEAREAILTLKKKHELYIITSRPEHIANDTYQWLEIHFPETFSGVYFASNTHNKKKADICKELGVQLMIEDNFDYAFNCASNDIYALLLDFPWNRREGEHSKIKRVSSWSEIVSLLTN